MPGFPSGEYELISHLSAILQRGQGPLDSRYELGIGDDAAVRRGSDGERIVLTADTSVQNVHFSLEYMSLAEAGYRSMVSNVSDCAAMGARPDSALVQLVFPGGGSGIAREVELVYEGFSEACNRYGFPIVGGDLSTGPSWVIAITLVGSAAREQRLLRRVGARPGDSLWITGMPGRSAAGLAALRKWGRQDVPDQFRDLAAAHLRPEARVEIGLALASCEDVHAMMDLSDGISKDGRTLCYENRLGLVLSIDSSRIPIQMVELSEAVGITWQDLFLHGGEDYELLFAASPEFDPAALFPEVTSAGFLRVGEFSNDPQRFVLKCDGGDETDVPGQSWDHLG